MLDVKLVDSKTEPQHAACRAADGVLEEFLPLIDGVAAELSGLERDVSDDVEGSTPHAMDEAEDEDHCLERSGRAQRIGPAAFSGLMADERLMSRLPKALHKQAGVCGEATCVSTIAKAVRLPYGVMALRWRRRRVCTG